MPQTLRYGTNGTFQVDIPDEMLLGRFRTDGLNCLDDPAAAMAAALSDPLQFPPLASATVAGDRIAITVEPGLPKCEALVAGVIHELLANGSDASNITIVVTEEDADRAARLPVEVRREVNVVVHRTNGYNDLAYLANSKAGQPIYMNRAICDADVVIPIGVFRLRPDRCSIHTCLYPVFAGNPEDETVEEGEDVAQPVPRGAENADAGEVAWLLGAQFAVQVVPGFGDGVLQILAGDANAVAERGRAICESTWRFEIPRRAGLVVATIDGGPEQQTWENFVRALLNASRAVSEGGAIVICSELSHQPDRGRLKLSAHDGFADLQCNAHVYLLSQLSGDVVEDLGMGHVASTDQISRLSHQYDSCVLVPSAQHAVVVALDD